jgi:hypothetical protein
MNAKHNTYAYFIFFKKKLGFKMKLIKMGVIQQRKKGKRRGNDN